MVLTCFQTHNFKRGPSYWKLNASVLKDVDYINEMNANIDSFFSPENPEANPVKRFELMKIMVKTETVKSLLL